MHPDPRHDEHAPFHDADYRPVRQSAGPKARRNPLYTDQWASAGKIGCQESAYNADASKASARHQSSLFAGHAKVFSGFWSMVTANPPLPPFSKVGCFLSVILDIL